MGVVKREMGSITITPSLVLVEGNREERIVEEKADDGEEGE